MTPPERRLEGWERWEQRIYGWLPYPLLAISLLATAFDNRITHAHLLWSVGLSVVTAAWVWFINPPTDEREEIGAPFRAISVVQFVVLLGLTAVLVMFSGWFGIFAFCNYLFALLMLPGKWRFAGIIGNAAIVAMSYTAGIPRTGSAWAAYLILFVIIAALASTFGHFGWAAAEQAGRHRKVIADLEEANRRLELALDENAGLHAQLLVQAREAGVLDERQRMAREIHDTLAQGLAGIITQLEAADQARDARQPQWRSHVDTARALARDSLTEARRSVAGLRPRQLEQVRLPEAIAEAAREWSSSTGVAVTVETTGDPRPMIADVELALFRVCQESLTNVGKHANAGRVGLTLSYMDDVVTLDVRDDGVGFQPENARVPDTVSGYGLAGMRQRVQRVAGTLEVESTPGEGTAVSANVPAIPVEAQ
ncbi:MAG TPA: sensor histidine kinase [Mycobacteriales bacterium]|jgi:signal transduction histidine kinase|nr:sensor histidine kinase [Mycobacteriales bacterium]